jgi:hypothetical protein
MKRNLVLILGVLLVFCGALVSCDFEQKYSYELYSISFSTARDIRFHWDDPLTWAKTQSGTRKIDSGKGLTIDDVRQKGRDLGLHNVEGINWNDTVNKIEKEGNRIVTWTSSANEYRLVYFYAD